MFSGKSILSAALLKVLEKEVDRLYDKAIVRYLGPWAIDKAIFFGSEEEQKKWEKKNIKPFMTLPGLVSASALNGGAKPSEELIEQLIDNTKEYFDGYRAQTKAQVRARVQNFVREAAISGKELDPEVVLGGQLADAFKTATVQAKRLVDTESTTARNLGGLEAVVHVSKKQGVDDPTVAFLSINDKHRCSECTRLHTIDGATPRVWKLSEVGHGYHKKGETNPKIGGLHPNCRCTLVSIELGYGFDSSGKITYKHEGYSEYRNQKGLNKSIPYEYHECNDLNKASPPPNFKKLGFEPREAPILSTRNQIRSKAATTTAASIADAGTKAPIPFNKLLSDEKQTIKDAAMLLGNKHSRVDVKKKHSGSAAYSGAGMYVFSENQFTPNRAADETFGTQQHESFHSTLSRLTEKHGHEARRFLVDNLFAAIPKQYQADVLKLQDYHSNKAHTPSIHREEALARVLNFMNSPSARLKFNSDNRNLADEQFDGGKFFDRIKKAYQAIRAAAEVADESWMTQIKPWSTGLRSPSTPSPLTPAQSLDRIRQAAMRSKIAKSELTKNEDQGHKIIESSPHSIVYTRRVSTRKTPNYGDRFGQTWEPHGEYMTDVEREVPANHESLSPRTEGKDTTWFQHGKIHFQNPLVIQSPEGDYIGWKKALSDHFGGLTGKKLSSHLTKLGYDGVINKQMQNGSFYNGEVVNLNGKKEIIKDYEPEALSRARGGAPKVKKSEVLDKVTLTPESTASRMSMHLPSDHEAFDRVDTYDAGDGLYHHVYWKNRGSGFKGHLDVLTDSPNPADYHRATASSSMWTAPWNYDSMSRRGNLPWKDGEVTTVGEAVSKVKGHGTKLYSSMARVHRRLASDSSTSVGANALWEKLVKLPEFAGSTGYGDGDVHFIEHTGQPTRPISSIDGDGRNLKRLLANPVSPFSSSIRTFPDNYMEVEVNHRDKGRSGITSFFVDHQNKTLHRGLVHNFNNWDDDHQGAATTALKAAKSATGYEQVNLQTPDENEQKRIQGHGSNLTKSDRPTSEYLSELARYGWEPTGRSAKHITLTNKLFPATRPLAISHSEAKRISANNMENNAKDAGLIWDYNGMKPNPKHPYAKHYVEHGLLEPEDDGVRTWTPDNHDGQTMDINKVLSLKPDVDMDWRTAKHLATFKTGNHSGIPPIKVMDGGDGNFYAEDGDEQLEAARAHGMTHVPVVMSGEEIKKSTRKSKSEKLAKSTTLGLNTLYNRVYPFIDEQKREKNHTFDDTVVNNITNHLRDAPLVIHVPARRLPDIANDGRFKNLFETGFGNGEEDTDFRSEWEENMGIPLDTPGEERPIYGALHYAHDSDEGNHGPAYGYGDVWLELHPDVKKRSTYTRDDSSTVGAGEVFHYDKLEDLAHHILSRRESPYYKDLLKAHLLHHGLSHLEVGHPEREGKGASKFRGDNVNDMPYIEAQIHGGINPAKDVKRINVTSDLGCSKAMAFGHKFGIPVVLHRNVWDPETDKYNRSSEEVYTPPGMEPEIDNTPDIDEPVPVKPKSPAAPKTKNPIPPRVEESGSAETP